MKERKYNPADYVGQTIGSLAIERAELEPLKNRNEFRAIVFGHCTNCGAPVRRTLLSVLRDPPKYCRNCPRPLMESLKSYAYKRDAIAAEFSGKTFGCIHVERVANERDKNGRAINIAHGHCINCGTEMAYPVTVLRHNPPMHCRNCLESAGYPAMNRPADPKNYIGKTFGAMFVDDVRMELNKRGKRLSVAYGHCTCCGAPMRRGISALKRAPKTCCHQNKPAPHGAGICLFRMVGAETVDLFKPCVHVSVPAVGLVVLKHFIQYVPLLGSGEALCK